MPDPLNQTHEVENHENALRALTHNDWWKEKEKRISSAAFRYPKFSVDIESLTTTQITLSHFHEGTGIAKFNVGKARHIHFDTIHEQDPLSPENKAHAHVYFRKTNSQFKKKYARKLADMCSMLIPPTLP